MISLSGSGSTTNEASRFRQTLQYASELLNNSIIDESGRPHLHGGLKTSDDVVLTAIAQLGLLRTKTDRAFVSLFDEKYQHIVAEVTDTSPFSASTKDDSLIFCGFGIPRHHGLCEQTLLESDHAFSSDPDQIHLTIVPDLLRDPQYRDKPSTLHGSPLRFYASVPIQTADGTSIGVYCVTRAEADDTWSDEYAHTLRTTSQAITLHLENSRAKAARWRSERMARGIGSFMEERTTMSGWQQGPNTAAFTGSSGMEGVLNMNQQRYEYNQDVLAGRSPRNSSSSANFRPAEVVANDPAILADDRLQSRSPSPHQATPSSTRNPEGGPLDSEFKDPKKSTRRGMIHSEFSRAANIIRESIEVEGFVFLDASCGAFRASGDRTADSGKFNSSCASSDISDEASDSHADQDPWWPCQVLGFATSAASSVDGHDSPPPQAAVPEIFLASLLRRYPRGKIFNFKQNGELDAIDSYEQERLAQMTSLQGVTQPVIDPTSPTTRPGLAPRSGSHQNDAKQLLRVFPRARCIAFVPVWDSRRNKWYAGGFAYTEQPKRTFTVEGELSFLRGFSIVAMSEVLRHELFLDDKAKSDTLSSISHELRSPLHGIILAVELMNGTDLTVTQGDILHTLEACGRTLTDTLDHLLDYSKINQFLTTTKRQRRARSGRGIKQNETNTVEAGMMTLNATIRLDKLAEEVIESVFAGFTFQFESVAQVRREIATSPDVAAHQHMDSLQAREEVFMHHRSAADASSQSLDVVVYFVADPTCAWVFDSEPGGIRRIIMNLFANSLKYTKSGVVKVSIEQSSSRGSHHKREKLVTITVSDTGAGIGPDFLRNGIFKPFSQENFLAPGTGLGLSIVKRITSKMGGHIVVTSDLGVGTAVKVTLPLAIPTSSPTDARSPDLDEFTHQREELKGLRIRLWGFNDDATIKSRTLAESICRDWLCLDVLPSHEDQTLVPDLVLATEHGLVSWESADALAKTPSVVICGNALVAHRRSAAAKESSKAIEFISQPIAPRKLAKVLMLVFKKWIDAQGATTIVRPLEPTWSGISHDHGQVDPESGKDTCSELAGLFAPLVVPSSVLPKSSPGLPKILPCDEYRGNFLLVDDNRINLKILCAYMKMLQSCYQSARNGHEAVGIYEQDPSKCRIILMDVSMPVMDGFEATRIIRQIEKKKNIEPATIVALTGLASQEAQREALGSGMDLFLTKPVKLQELGEILQSRGVLPRGGQS